MSETLTATDEERRAITALKRLAKRWPKTLWLFSASGDLYVMKRPPDGDRYRLRGGKVDPEAILEQIDIPNDGGDW